MYNDRNLIRSMLSLGISALLLFIFCNLSGCQDSHPDPNALNFAPTSSTPAQPASKSPRHKYAMVVSIPSMALQSPRVVESKIGKASAITTITNTPANMPGEYRNYKSISESLPAQVRYHRSKAVNFIIYTDKTFPDPHALLGGFGFQNFPDTPDVDAPAGKRWKDVKVGSVHFLEVSVENSDFDGSKGWDILTAKVRE